MKDGAGDSPVSGKKHPIIKQFLNAEAQARETEARYQQCLCTNIPNSQSRMAYEAMSDAASALEKAFEEMISMTGLCTATKLGDESA